MSSGRPGESVSPTSQSCFAVAIIGIGLAGTAGFSRKRASEKNQELLWMGNQFREAIGLYQRTPGGASAIRNGWKILWRTSGTSMFSATPSRLQDPMTGKNT
jgi:hypothetical protein